VLAAELLAAGMATGDRAWQMPLWDDYIGQLKSNFADMSNLGGAPAGSITAALFLEQFVSKDTAWAHVDLYSWNASTRPGRPEGGEAMTLRAFFNVIAKRFPPVA